MTPLRIFGFLVFLGAALPLSAQVEQATILRTVCCDVVPGASVTVLNSGSGERRVTRLTEDKRFQFRWEMYNATNAIQSAREETKFMEKLL